MLLQRKGGPDCCTSVDFRWSTAKWNLCILNYWGTLSASEYPNKNKTLHYLMSKIWLQYVSVSQCVGGLHPEWQSQPSAWPCQRCVSSSWFMAPGAPLSLFLPGHSVFSSGGWRKVMLSTLCCLLVWQLISKQEGRDGNRGHFSRIGSDAVK